MPIQIGKWKCPICGEHYDDRGSAERCLDRCSSDLYVEQLEPEGYACSMCKKPFVDSRYHHSAGQATECEQKHVENEDKYYYWFVTQQTKTCRERR